MERPIRVIQLSDTHFLEAGLEAEGGGAYNTSLAFDHVLDHIDKKHDRVLLDSNPP